MIIGERWIGKFDRVQVMVCFALLRNLNFFLSHKLDYYVYY